MYFFSSFFTVAAKNLTKIVAYHIYHQLVATNLITGGSFFNNGCNKIQDPSSPIILHHFLLQQKSRVSGSFSRCLLQQKNVAPSSPVTHFKMDVHSTKIHLDTSVLAISNMDEHSSIFMSRYQMNVLTTKIHLDTSVYQQVIQIRVVAF